MCSRKVYGSVLVVLAVYFTIFLRLQYRTGSSRRGHTRVIAYFQKHEPRNSSTPNKKCKLNVSSPIGDNPTIKTDPSKFILPTLYNGPTNQMIGLRDAAYLAILLNRTLILPKFYKHLTDQTGFKKIDPRLRVDLARLSKFMSVVPYSYSQDICDNHFGIVFLGQAQTKQHYGIQAEALENLNFTVSPGLNGQNYNVVRNPKDAAVVRRPTDLKRYYESNAKCALLYYAYRSVGVREEPKYLQQAKDAFQSNDREFFFPNTSKELLYAAVFNRVGKPRFIEKICNSFLRDVVGTNGYLAVHWRFDPDDWLRKCKWDSRSQIDNMCRQIGRIDGEEIVKAAMKHIRRLPKVVVSPVLYFATPLDNKELIRKVKIAVRNLNRRQRTRLKIFTGLELLEYLRKYKNCSELSDHTEDILASVEKQICVTADSFMFSTHSSWSAEVSSQRVGKKQAKFDEDILRVTTEVMKSPN